MTSFKLEHYQAHYILDGSPFYYSEDDPSPDPRLPKDARIFCKCIGMNMCPCDGGMVAWRKTRVVGFCRYNRTYVSSSLRNTSTLTMAGTWVTPRYRQKRLAVQMWARIFRCLRSGTQIDVITVSTKGDFLIEKLRILHPRLSFNVEQGCRYPVLEADRGKSIAIGI